MERQHVTPCTCIQVCQYVLPIHAFYWYRGECRLELAIMFIRCNRTSSHTAFSQLYKGQEMQAPQCLYLFGRPNGYPRTQLPLFPHPQGCVGISRMRTLCVGHFDKERLRPLVCHRSFTHFFSHKCMVCMSTHSSTHQAFVAKKAAITFYTHLSQLYGSFQRNRPLTFIFAGRPWSVQKRLKLFFTVSNNPIMVACLFPVTALTNGHKLGG